MLPCCRWSSESGRVRMWLAVVTGPCTTYLTRDVRNRWRWDAIQLRQQGPEIGTDGPFVWGRDSDATRIGLATEAPNKRASILWSAAAFTGDFTDDAFMMFDSVINWATNSKANARVGFFPGPIGQGAIDLRDRLVAAGHTVTDIPDVASLPAADQLDLLIHSEEAAPPPRRPLLATMCLSSRSMPATMTTPRSFALATPSLIRIPCPSMSRLQMPATRLWVVRLGRSIGLLSA